MLIHFFSCLKKYYSVDDCLEKIQGEEKLFSHLFYCIFYLFFLFLIICFYFYFFFAVLYINKLKGIGDEFKCRNNESGFFLNNIRFYHCPSIKLFLAYQCLFSLILSNPWFLFDNTILLLYLSSIFYSAYDGKKII